MTVQPGRIVRAAKISASGRSFVRHSPSIIPCASCGSVWYGLYALPSRRRVGRNHRGSTLPLNQRRASFTVPALKPRSARTSAAFCSDQ